MVAQLRKSGVGIAHDQFRKTTYHVWNEVIHRERRPAVCSGEQVQKRHHADEPDVRDEYAQTCENDMSERHTEARKNGCTYAAPS